jgi:DNA polymerase V
VPARDTGALIRAALRGFDRIYRPGYAYHKAGVLLMDLVPATLAQATLFQTAVEDSARAAHRMEVLDRINQRYGRETLRYASAALSDQWRMRAQLKSPAYTTRWAELPIIKMD